MAHQFIGISDTSGESQGGNRGADIKINLKSQALSLAIFRIEIFKSIGAGISGRL